MTLVCSVHTTKNSTIAVTEHDGNLDTAPFACVNIEGFDLYLPGGTGKAVACALCEATGATYTFQDYRNG